MNIQIENFSSIFSQLDMDPTEDIIIERETSVATQPVADKKIEPRWAGQALRGYESMMRERAAACEAGR